MAIVQESGNRGVGGFMGKFQRKWDAQRAIDAQEEMRRRRAMRAEKAPAATRARLPAATSRRR